jgi:uncharacterized protein
MPMSNRETRTAGEFRIEKRADGGGRVVSGYAAVFNQETDIGGMFREVIRPGAFKGAVGRDDVRLLIEHEGLPLARTKSGTLTLREDEHGLFMEAGLDERDPDVTRIVPKMERADLNQMSFAFTMRGGVQSWDETNPDNPLRVIETIGELFDVSIVTYGAYPTTEVGLRSLEDHRAEKSKKDAEAEAAEKERKRQNYTAMVTRLKLAKKLDLRQRTTRGA